MSEAPLKFPDLPADHPANQEAPEAQTKPVTTEATGSTAASVPAAEFYGPLTADALNALLEQRPEAEVLCVAPNLQETAEHLEGVNIRRPLTLSVEPHDAPDVWYLNTRAEVDERRAAQGSPPLGTSDFAASFEAEESEVPAETEQQKDPGPSVTVPSGVAHDGSVYRARSDDDVLTNTFCKVIAGPYTGRYGVYITTASLGADGWPAEVVVRTRDAEDENIVVAYADIRPDVAGRR